MTSRPVPKAALGVPGLDDILAGGLARDRVYLLEGSPGTGKTTIALQFLLEGAAPGENGPLHHPVRDRGGAARTAPPRTAGRSTGDRHLRAGAAREPARRRAAAEPALLVRPRARRDHPLIFEAVERCKPDARRDRQPVRDPPAGAELAALPPPDAGAEALLRPARRHRAAARRPHHRGQRQDGAQRRPRRHPAGGAGARTTAPSGGACGSSSTAASRFRGGYHDFTIETGGLEVFPRLVAAEHKTDFARDAARQRHRRARRAARRRPRARLEHADPRPRRHRQVAAGAAFRVWPPSSAASARRCSSSTRSSACCSPAPRRSASTSRRCATPASCSSSRSTRPSCRRASSRTGCATASTQHGDPHRRDRQPQRLPGRHAGGAVPDPAHARAAAVPEPAGRHAPS